MNITFEKVDSHSELCERLKRGDKGVVLGDEDESPNEYFLASIPGCLIGICSEGHGIQPSILLDTASGAAWIGYNMKVVKLDTNECRMKCVVHLDSAFFAFMCRMPDRSVIVVHELGAVRISSSGSCLWNVSTDVVIDFGDCGNVVSLRTQDETISISKDQGNRL